MRRNPFLISMLMVGILFAVVGVILVVAAYSQVGGDPASGLGALLLASQLAGSGVSVAGFGIFLLLVAWIIAAARWRSPDV